MEKVTVLVSEYISLNPSVKEGLRSDLINYSKLARKIIDNPTYFDAAVIAIRRYKNKIKPKTPILELFSDISNIKLKKYDDLLIISLHCPKDISKRLIAHITSYFEEKNIELVTMSFADHRITFIIHTKDRKVALSLF